MSEQVVGSSASSRRSPVMTSLTDHSVESILRHSSSGITHRAISGVSSTSPGIVADHADVTADKAPPSSTKLGDGHYTTSAASDDVCSSSLSGTKPHLELDSQDLWSQFYSLCTEMVITKSGRSVTDRYFPTSKNCCIRSLMWFKQLLKLPFHRVNDIATVT